ncbi:MAG: type II secretion system protein GspK [Sedimentisphaerales bacterium]
MNGQEDKIRVSEHRTGFALILVIVVLVVLTAIVYRASSSISQWKHRQQYMIDYQIARYGCESGLKYALATVNGLTPAYVSRPNEPDFSDLFTMSDEKYKQMMQDWAYKLGMEIDANNLGKDNFTANFMDFRSLFKSNDVNDLNSLPADYNLFSEPNGLYVHGPYGPPWPYVVEPVEIEFGDARVRIEIIDENAKLPLCWGISSDEKVKKEAKAAVVTFCEWMQMEPNEIEPLLKQLAGIKEIKPFSVNLKPVVTATSQQAAPVEEEANKSPQSRRMARRARTRASQRTRSTTVQETRSQMAHTMDFAKLMHSPMIDLEELAKPVNEDENRSESALKYISLWGTGQVNVNTAPRQVLEAAFTFGGDAAEIAEQIIKMRKEIPFQNIDDLKKRLFSYNDSIEKSKSYITFQSNCFSIRVSATSGVAKVSATAGVKKEKEGNAQKIGIIIE